MHLWDEKPNWRFWDLSSRICQIFWFSQWHVDFKIKVWRNTFKKNIFCWSSGAAYSRDGVKLVFWNVSLTFLKKRDYCNIWGHWKDSFVICCSIHGTCMTNTQITQPLLLSLIRHNQVILCKRDQTSWPCWWHIHLSGERRFCCTKTLIKKSYVMLFNKNDEKICQNDCFLKWLLVKKTTVNRSYPFIKVSVDHSFLQIVEKCVFHLFFFSCKFS